MGNLQEDRSGINNPKGGQPESVVEGIRHVSEDRIGNKRTDKDGFETPQEWHIALNKNNAQSISGLKIAINSELNSSEESKGDAKSEVEE